MRREDVISKVVALYHGAFIFVGHPEYETTREAIVMLKIVDVYQMLITNIPGQDATGNIQVATNISGFKVENIEPTDEHFIVELALNSQLYEAYVAISSGIQKTSRLVHQ